MSDLSFVQYDTAPSIFGTLTNITKEDLEAANEIRFQMRLENKLAFKVDGVATVEDADELVVRYDWDELDLSMPGEYITRWQIEFANGAIEHTEPENTLTVDPA